LVVVNLADEAHDVAFDLPDFAGRQPVDVLTGECWPEISSEAYAFSLAPYGYHWLRF